MPFGDYSSFDDCVKKNRKKRDPEAYCGKIKHQVEGKKKRPSKTRRKKKHG